MHTTELLTNNQPSERLKVHIGMFSTQQQVYVSALQRAPGFNDNCDGLKTIAVLESRGACTGDAPTHTWLRSFKREAKTRSFPSLACVCAERTGVSLWPMAQVAIQANRKLYRPYFPSCTLPSYNILEGVPLDIASTGMSPASAFLYGDSFARRLTVVDFLCVLVANAVRMAGICPEPILGHLDLEAKDGKGPDGQRAALHHPPVSVVHHHTVSVLHRAWCNSAVIRTVAVVLSLLLLLLLFSGVLKCKWTMPLPFKSKPQGALNTNRSNKRKISLTYHLPDIHVTVCDLRPASSPRRPGGMERPGDDFEQTHNVRVAAKDTLFGGVVSRLQVLNISLLRSGPFLSAVRPCILVGPGSVPVALFLLLCLFVPTH